MKIFDWLPKAGEKRSVPGGIIWCESWQTEFQRGDVIEGEILLRFLVDKNHYRQTKKATEVVLTLTE